MMPQTRKLNPRIAADLKEAFEDGRLKDMIAETEVPDLWLKHLQLSVNLETLRNTWRGAKKKGKRAMRQKDMLQLAERKKVGPAGGPARIVPAIHE